MKVTRPMIERAREYASKEQLIVSDHQIEGLLRAAHQDQAEPARPFEGQTAIGVVDGRTVVVDG